MDKQYVLKRLEKIRWELEDMLNTMIEFDFSIDADEFSDIKDNIECCIEEIEGKL